MKGGSIRVTNCPSLLGSEEAPGTWDFSVLTWRCLCVLNKLGCSVTLLEAMNASLPQKLSYSGLARSD